ncbi:30S ribosomal protein S3 [Candidatus Fokinia solitaria]|uniref:Small ribosomal subunit protein uS3 n=1 Tax=Candidatus Fokinia solitaria TaxID=1802984 RepID=A0A2U8BSF9_9RICK|nr:30S ribosomal protein S3 [Candidatus Fokinia solitaria]AWD33294.1 30S ribosomal protein S3 [Candidatus Fokinia solitaria]
MGQKANPVGLRLGINRSTDSMWYASKADYPRILRQDIAVRELIEQRFGNALISKIEMRRSSSKLNVRIVATKPMVILGKSGAETDTLKKSIADIADQGLEINVIVDTEKKPLLQSRVVAKMISQQLEQRVAPKQAMKKAIRDVMKSGAYGVRIAISGRLGGAEIARTEWQKDGSVPLHTLRMPIEKSNAVAHTTYGVLGVAVIIAAHPNSVHEEEQHS